jgi:hypothetical protein
MSTTADQTDQGTDQAAADAGRKSYDESYVKSLRDEAKRSREARQEIERERDDLKKSVEAREKKELEEKQQFKELLDKERAEREADSKKSAEALKARDRRVILAEAKALAVKAGIIDADDVKGAIDLDDLRIDDDGNVVGLAEKIDALKAAKAHWFKGDDKAESKKRAVVTPDRKDGSADSGVDWRKKSAEEVRLELKKYGVT